jgi:hypothetical protein
MGTMRRRRAQRRKVSLRCPTTSSSIRRKIALKVGLHRSARARASTSACERRSTCSRTCGRSGTSRPYRRA